jgi:hypothetical protein
LNDDDASYEFLFISDLIIFLSPLIIGFLTVIVVGFKVLEVKLSFSFVFANQILSLFFVSRVLYE